MLGGGETLGLLEIAMRAALASAGARLLEAVLAGEDGYCGPRAACGGCGGQAGYARVPGKTVTTPLGPGRPRRAWAHRRDSGHRVAAPPPQLGVGRAAPLPAPLPPT